MLTVGSPFQVAREALTPDTLSLVSEATARQTSRDSESIFRPGSGANDAETTARPKAATGSGDGPAGAHTARACRWERAEKGLKSVKKGPEMGKRVSAETLSQLFFTQ